MSNRACMFSDLRKDAMEVRRARLLGADDKKTRQVLTRWRRLW